MKHRFFLSLILFFSVCSLSAQSVEQLIAEALSAETEASAVAKLQTARKMTLAQGRTKDYFDVCLNLMVVYSTFSNYKDYDAALRQMRKEMQAQGGQLTASARAELTENLTLFTGIYLYYTSDYTAAIDTFKVLENSNETAVTYLATLKKKRGEYREAIGYFFKDNSWLTRQGQTEYIPLNYKHIGECYAHIPGEAAQALEYLKLAEVTTQKAFESNTDPQKTDARRNRYVSALQALARFYLKIDQPDLAAPLLRAITHTRVNDKDVAADTEALYGDFYAEKKDYSAALQHYRTALGARRGLYEGKNNRIAEVQTAIGQVLAAQGHLDEAMAAYQEAIAGYVPGFTSYDALDSPTDLRQVSAPLGLLRALAHKTAALVAANRQQPAPQREQAALGSIQLALQLMDDLCYSIPSEEDIQALLTEVYPVYEDAIGLCYEMGKRGDQARYWGMAFDWAERSKAFLLSLAFQRAEARMSARLPDGDAQREMELRQNIAALQFEIREKYEAEGSHDLQAITRMESQLHERKQQLAEVVEQLRQRYPAYCQARYMERGKSLTDLQRYLSKQQAGLLEYFIGDQTAFVFLVKSGDVFIQPMPFDPKLGAKVAALTESIRQYRGDLPQAEREKRLQVYTEQGFALYQTLVGQPLGGHALPFRVIIVPDNVIGYIPFDALLTDAVRPGALLKDYPFVLKGHQISYAYSASSLLALTSQPPRRGQRTPYFLGVAPSFDGNSADPAMQDARPDKNNRYAALPDNISLVQRIREQLGGLTLVRKEANCRNVARCLLAARFALFITHGQGNEHSGQASHLVLADTNAAGGYAPLYAWALFNWNVAADLVMLDACETHVGDYQRGVGIINLNLGFTCAGARSVISTLWSIYDQPSNELTENFCRRLCPLFFAPPKDEALRETKLAMLADNKKAHPVYWGAFVAYGDMAPMPARWEASAGLVLAAAFAAALLGLWFFKWRRKA